MATARGWVSPSVLPGFGMTLGFAGLFLTFIVLIPLRHADHPGEQSAAR